MRPKPLFGDPCNRCGACCLEGPCGLAMSIFGLDPESGRCPAVRPDGIGGWFCGVVELRSLTAPQREAALVAIGSGFGCDMSRADDPADVAARALRKPQMVKAVYDARARASREALTVLRHWKLAPP